MDSSTQQAAHGPSNHSHPPALTSSWIREGGHGSRHPLDHFDFCLWDFGNHDYKSATLAETMAIKSKFNAQAVIQQKPFIIVVTPTPPQPEPLTIASCPALFISPETYRSSWSASGVHDNSGYSNPRVPDPVATNLRRLLPWYFPTNAECRMVIRELSQLVHIDKLTFTYPYMVVKVSQDGRTYARGSLPGIVAGYTTFYNHNGSSADTEVLGDIASAPERERIQQLDYLLDLLRLHINAGELAWDQEIIARS